MYSVNYDRLEEMASNAIKSDTSTVGNFIKLSKNDVHSILKSAK